MELPKRKQPRLRGYDYATQNYYFITICTHQKSNLFGTVEARSAFGSIAEEELLQISQHFTGVEIDQYIIMPNHLHAIVVIGGEPNESRPTLSTIVGLYKSGVSKRIHQIDPELKIWQTSFYDKIIRDDAGYQEVWAYIAGNPLK